MNGVIERVDTISDVPAEWDDLAGSTFQRREFLAHCERYNQCRQRYYLLSSGGTMLAGAAVYALELDLLTWLNLRSPVQMQIIGIPCSVSCPGLLGEETVQQELLRGILGSERGIVLCLNLDRMLYNTGMSLGRTWPSVLFANRFHSWEEYRSSLRSVYRRRLSAIERTLERLSIRTAPCSAFTEEMYRLYLDVLKRSEGKLEMLTSEFFKRLPARFQLMTLSDNGRLCGWAITLIEEDRYTFFLGGQDYSTLPREIYLAKLATILRAGIESGARVIDLGQSAEIQKTRLGGVCQEKLMLVHHHNLLLDRALRASMGILSYRRRVPQTHVYREKVQ